MSYLNETFEIAATVVTSVTSDSRANWLPVLNFIGIFVIVISSLTYVQHG
jgi:hypothetical protein